MAKQNSAKYKGIATVETALVLALLILVVIGGLDLALQFYVRHNMSRASREAARSLAVQGATLAQAQQAALDTLTGINANFTIEAQFTENDVTATVTVPRDDISIGLFPRSGPQNISATTTMRRED